MDVLDALVRDALVAIALLTLPVLGIATAVGAAVAVLQAATQVQEQTLTLLPKLVVVGAVVTLGGRFGLDLCAQLLVEALGRIPALVSAG